MKVLTSPLISTDAVGGLKFDLENLPKIHCALERMGGSNILDFASMTASLKRLDLPDAGAVERNRHHLLALDLNPLITSDEPLAQIYFLHDLQTAGVKRKKDIDARIDQFDRNLQLDVSFGMHLKAAKTASALKDMGILQRDIIGGKYGEYRRVLKEFNVDLVDFTTYACALKKLDVKVEDIVAERRDRYAKTLTSLSKKGFWKDYLELAANLKELGHLTVESNKTELPPVRDYR